MNTVSSRVVHEWLHAAKIRGHDLKALLQDSHISWQCYESSRARISGKQLACLGVQIQRVLNDHFMGYGREPLHPALLDRVLIKILARAANLKQVLSEWRDFYNLVQRTGLIVTTFGARECTYQLRIREELGHRGAHVSMLNSAMLKLRLFSWMIGKEIKPNVIGFTESSAIGGGEYPEVLPGQVLFDQPHHFFSFDSGYLRYPIVRTLQECLEYKKRLPDDFFAIPGDEACFSRRVEAAMREMLDARFCLPTIDCVAEELYLSARGLRRKLAAEGASFRGLKDKMRYDQAILQLTRTDAPIGQIAADLGFSGAMTFSRAFKAWSDIAPQEYRRRHAAV